MKTIVYPQCEGCGQIIKEPKEGYSLIGAIYPAELAPDLQQGLEPIIGGWEGDETDHNSYPTATAWCRKCFISKLVDALDALNQQSEPQQGPKE